MKQEDLYREVKYEVMGEQRLAYIDIGSGDETLVFIHGMGSNLKAWFKNISVLSKKFRCIAVDLPGHGLSSKLATPFEIFRVRDLLIDFFEGIELTKDVSLVGHSLGGLLSITIAHTRPDLISRLALIASAGIESFSVGELELVKEYFTADFLAAYSSKLISKNFELNFYEMPEDARFMIEDRQELARDKDRYYEFCETISECTVAILSTNVLSLLSELELPVLMFYGKNDKLVPHHILHPDMDTQEIAELGEEKMKNGKLVLFSECGHFVQWERAEEVSEALGNWGKK